MPALLASDTVSVPCSCGGKLYPRHDACPSCGAPVSPEARTALEARLEGTHPNYREAKTQVRRSATLLLVLGLLHLAFGFFSYDNALVGLALLGCWHMAMRAPLAAMTTGLAIWTLVNLSLFLIHPASFVLSFLSPALLGILFGKLAVCLLLVRATWVARRLRLIEQGLVA
jgi:hypothetical protein